MKKKSVIVSYSPGVQNEVDDKVLEIAEKHNARLLGRGCWNTPEQDRDLQFQISPKNAKNFARRLREQKFTTVKTWKVKVLHRRYYDFAA